MKKTAGRRIFMKRLVLAPGFSAAIFLVTILSNKFPLIASPSTAAFLFLIIVLLSAFFGDAIIGIIVSLIATVCFDYFFLPPVGTFSITAFPDVIALTAFLLTAVIISRLTASARENADSAKNYDKALAGLKEFGSWLVSIPGDQLTLAKIAQAALDIFKLEYCSVHAFGSGKWNHFSGTAQLDLSREIEKRALKLIEDHPTSVMEFAEESIIGVQYGQVNIGGAPHALFAVKSANLPLPVIDILTHQVGLRLLEASQKIPAPGISTVPGK
jgi:K+-sensing histidine kinase KdpD